MSAVTPRFWAGPIRYCRWAARERPAYFWSVIIGATGPLMLVTVPPLRKAMGDEDAPTIPLSYPGRFPPPPPTHQQTQANTCRLEERAL